MNISAELIAIGILGVSLVSLGWKVTGDLRQEIHHVRSDVAKLGDRIGSLEQRMGSLEQRMGGLEQRMARLEGWIKGRLVKQPELKAKPATSP